MDPLTLLAVVGTEKAGGAATAGGELDALFAGLEGSPERRLLVQLGALAAYEGAGRRALRAPSVEPAPEDSRPACSAAAARLLESLLEGSQADLLVEACGLLASSGRRLPWELLPAALLAREKSPRAALASVLGPRATWLARTSGEPAFAWILAEEPSGPEDADAGARHFEEGGPAERVAALGALLSRDREAARRRLVEVFPREKAERRAAFVKALEAGLSPEDEPFLESCLDDRAPTVVEAAAGLLARLEGSALAGRMRARLASVLSFTQGTLTVAPPGAPDAAGRRDGLPSKAPPGKGAKAFFLEELLAAAPPAALRELVPLPAREAVALLRADDYRGPLLAGLARAALASGAGELVAALFDVAREGKKEDELGAHLPALAAALPGDEAAARVLSPGAEASLLSILVPRLRRPFAPQVAEHLLGRARQRAGERVFEEIALLPPLALGLPPVLLEKALSPFGLPEPADGEAWEVRAWRSAVEKLQETVRTRLALRRELAAEAPTDPRG